MSTASTSGNSQRPLPRAGGQANDFLPLDDGMGLLQRRLHEKLIDRGARQLGGTTLRLIDLAGYASADTVLLGDGGSHHGLLAFIERREYLCRQNGVTHFQRLCVTAQKFPEAYPYTAS